MDGGADFEILIHRLNQHLRRGVTSHRFAKCRSRKFKRLGNPGLVRSPFGLRECRKMSLNRRPVTTSGWSRQCRSRTKRGDIIEGRPSKTHEGLKWKAHVGSNTFNLTEQCHDMICRDTRSSVIERPVAISDGDGRSTK